MTLAPVLDDRFARELPELAIPWQAAEAPSPGLVVLNEPLAVSLGLDVDWLRSPEGVAFLTGAGAHGVAQAYAGHQFGGFNPRLGDGRALLLGSLEGFDIHLKGSGPTPFSRGGDGFAAIGPMLREYVISEFMHAAGIPTTRSLAVVSTGRPVRRETGLLPGALVVRVASSHLRVGTFQFAASNEDLLRRLVTHAGFSSAAELLSSVIDRQARLIAQWMLVGFIHGVMNTDNMTISGETIDYGPCAFMEAYDPRTVFSSIDREGRYAYGNQPAIGEWNLVRLAESLLPLLDSVEEAQELLGAYRPAYSSAFSEGMRAKLGLAVADDELVQELLPQLHESRVDYTSFFRDLARGAAVRDQFIDIVRFDAWTSKWLALKPSADEMDQVNPIYVPRNHLVEQALEDVDIAPLLEAITRPFEQRAGLEPFAVPGPADASYQTFCGT